MHLLDSVGKNKNIKYISNYHEQASSICAESYSRMKNHFGACLVTTGPGSTNAITGILGAWLDSIPLIVLSGQVKTQIIANYKKLRQLGPQEANIIPMVTPITKYAVTVTNPKTIKYHLEKAYFLSKSGRPGPVWINIPLDVQGGQIDKNDLISFYPPKHKKNYAYLKEQVDKTLLFLKEAKRPILILGNGTRLSNSLPILHQLINKLKIPILLPFNGLDLISTSHPLLAGKFGPVGQRRGNFALQNSDLILAIGASLSITSTGFNFNNFAPNAKKIMVNIDRQELFKNTVKIDLPVQVDATDFITELLPRLNNFQPEYPSTWLKTIRHWKEKYPDIIPEFFQDKKHVNSYVFFDKLSARLTKNDTVITGNSLDALGLYQSFKVKMGQRAYTNVNSGPMGWCLPGAIGACVGNGRKRTILITGDGSIQFNIQELNTVSYYKLPIKIFILNNQGYESIRSTQDNFFEGRYVGSDINSGVKNPDFKSLSKAYGIPYEKIQSNNELESKIKTVLKTVGPILCEVNLSSTQGRHPKASSYRRPDGKLESKPLEDMYPFLPKEEVQQNMHLFDKDKL